VQVYVASRASVNLFGKSEEESRRRAQACEIGGSPRRGFAPPGVARGS
jgi:hypothetical protein